MAPVVSSGPLATEVRIWSVFSREDRLVLALSDEPGEVNFAKMPDEDADPVECPYATLQCYDTKAEPELLNLIFKCHDVEELLERLRESGFKVRPGRPKPMRFARL